MKFTQRIIYTAGRIIPFACTVAMAQTPGEWTWMHGDNTTNSPGVFGTQGSPGPANKPPAVYEPCGEWRDNNGNFWLLGGARPDLGGATYGALWKYDVSANQWTWMKGPAGSFQIGVYGTQGVPSPANYPGARGWGACTWVDNAGNLWLFGGNGSNAVGPGGRMNDLWKYDVATNQWTWMHGPKDIMNAPGSYGTQGVAIPANLPPNRDEMACSWVDNAGNLWMGGGYNTTVIGNTYTTTFIEDMWKYDISTNEWTWMRGSGIGSFPVVKGTLNVPAPANTPGSTLPYCTWTDLSGKFWLFSGMIQNSMWMYDPAINQWAWKGGGWPATANYGTKCTAASANLPSNTTEHRSRVRDACGNFWLFGSGNLSGGNSSGNALWHYNVSTGRWTWVSGDNTGNPSVAVYGVQGVSAPVNKPGGRVGGTAWIDTTGNIWIFGGWVDINNYRNDLWRFVPDTVNCIPSCNITFSTLVTSTTILCNGFCNGTSTAIPNNGSVPYTYSWNTIPIQTTATATGLCAGTYTVIVSDAVNSSATATVTITQPTAITATATSTSASCGNNNGSVTVTVAGGTPGYFYSWSPSGGTNATATGLVSGTYTAIITDANGCTQTQTVTITSTNALTINVSSTQTGCAVNNGTATVTPLSGTTPYTYSWSNGQTNPIATGLGAGTYTITITDSSGCTQTQTATITQIPGPTASASASPNTIAIGASATLSAGGGGTYTWSPSAGLSCVTCSGPVAFPSGTSIYCVTVTDTATGCSDSACVIVMVELDCSNLGELYLPNAFSPNGDGENDKLQIYYGNPKCIKTFELVIYNRWGEKVLSTNDISVQWDGSYKGKIEGAAVFAYYLKTTLISGEEIIRKGNISLIR